MKKYLVLAIITIGSFTISCTTDNDIMPSSKLNVEPQKFDYSTVSREGDSLLNNETVTNTTTNPEPGDDLDTGGQGGSTPIKP